MAGTGRRSRNIPATKLREIGRAPGSRKEIAARYGVSVASVSASRKFARREDAGDWYDEDARIWINVER